MEDKTSKSSFNKAGSNPKKLKKVRNYSDKELTGKINMYSKVAKTEEQKKQMLEIKQEYDKKQQEKPGKRFQRNRNFRAGIRADLHPKETIERLENLDKISDQKDRNRTVTKAKDYYHRNYSLSKQYKEAKDHTKTKAKIVMDKG